jgi:hypothetical protein
MPDPTADLDRRARDAGFGTFESTAAGGFVFAGFNWFGFFGFGLENGLVR